MANTKQMKPLDLERFTGAEHLNLKVNHIESMSDQIVDVKPDGKQIVVAYAYQGEWLSNILAAGPSLIAELKALRKWRERATTAYRTYSEEHRTRGNPVAYQRFENAWNTAEMELNDEIQNNNRS